MVSRSEAVHDPWFLSYAHGEERMVKAHSVALDSRCLLHDNDCEERTPKWAHGVRQFTIRGS